MHSLTKLTVIGGVLLLFLSGCANAVKNEQDAVDKYVKGVRYAEVVCDQKKLPSLNEKISCYYNQKYPYIKDYSENMVPYYVKWRDQHLLAAHNLENSLNNQDIKYYKDRFDTFREKFNFIIRSVEPRYLSTNSKLDLAIKSKLSAVHCESGTAVQKLTCMRSAVTSAFSEVSPQTSELFSNQYEKLLVEAKIYDDNAGPIIDLAQKTYMDAHIEYNKELQEGIQSVASVRMTSAVAQDAKMHQNNEAAAKAVVGILGAVVYLGAAFTEGYAAGEAAKASAYPTSQRISCTSQQINGTTYTNCY